MTLIDIKNLNTNEITQVKKWCEQELTFRAEVGKGISEQQEAIGRLKEIRNYPDGCFEYSLDRNP